MPWWVAILLSVLLTAVVGYGAVAYRGGRRKRTVDPLPREVEARLGAALAAWVMRTRELIAQIEVFREDSLDRLAEERERADEPRDVGRQIRDANYLLTIRKARDAGKAWLEEFAGLTDVGLTALSDRGIEPGSLKDEFAFPWGLAVEFDRKQSRADEVEVILTALRRIEPHLHEIEQTLTAAPPSLYR